MQYVGSHHGAGNSVLATSQTEELAFRAVSAELRLLPWATRRDEVFALEITGDQRRFIDPPSVAEFLADDDDHPTFASFAVCAGDVVVGMVCFGQEESGHEPWQWWIPLLVIDRRYQGQGYGRAALQVAVESIRATAPDCGAIGLSCKPENAVAMRLYHSIGFVSAEANSRSVVDLWLELEPGEIL